MSGFVHLATSHFVILKLCYFCAEWQMHCKHFFFHSAFVIQNIPFNCVCVCVYSNNYIAIALHKAA